MTPLLGADRKNSSGDSYLVYVGTYTGPVSKGIYAFQFDTASDKATSLGLMTETVNPSFLAIDPSQKFLYAVNEISNYEGKKSGSITAFAIDGKSGNADIFESRGLRWVRALLSLFRQDGKACFR